jgi:hypothetical protein
MPVIAIAKRNLILAGGTAEPRCTGVILVGLFDQGGISPFSGSDTHAHITTSAVSGLSHKG